MKTLRQAIDDFLFHCEYEKNLSPKTIKFYRIDLTQFSLYIEQLDKGHDIRSIGKEEVKQYIKILYKHKPKTIKRKVATLKAFFNFLEFEDNIVVSPFRKIKVSIKEPKVLPVVMNLEEVKALFVVAYNELQKVVNEATYTYLEKLRDVTVLEMLFSTGVRVSELCNLKLNDVDTSIGVIKVNGKGSKERVIQICNQEVLKLIDRYRHLSNERVTHTTYFFQNRLNSRLSEQSVRHLVKRIVKKTEAQKNVTPHTFRHTVATLLLEQDVDIKFIQNILGHSSIMTTQIYTHVNSNKQREILEVRHPRRQFSAGSF